MADYRVEVLQALELEQVRAYINQHATDGAFWDWLNSTAVPLRLFFSIGRNLSPQEEAEKLSPSRQLVLWQYRIALDCTILERRSPIMTKLDEITMQTAFRSPSSALIVAATYEVLHTATVDDLPFEAQKSVFLFYVLAAADIPEMHDTIVQVIADNLDYFTNRAFLSTAVATYKAPLIKLLAEACLLNAGKAETLAGILEKATFQPRQNLSAEDYAQAILKWYGEVAERLRVNTEALYPAPPFLPFYVVEERCPSCGAVAPKDRKFCVKCGASLKSQ